MSQGSEAAEQMTREAIQISEAAAKLAALGAKNLAALCLALASLSCCIPFSKKKRKPKAKQG